ncbi:serine hydrolase domain-containing protein [Streptomyces sp. 549]|uniref:serine hydrolase domain-containing protein n=1 Tax=Streptomyces sp. 549 TaxID=3049076 RepID=UPI0024C3ED31|nr:serine hydrolase domain-containing protein [Streptomyces sp. 549]MDK1476668.1 serine hydrolase domain-containing protein [Streptomyces sp. 549]
MRTVPMCILSSPGIQASRTVGGHDPDAFVEIGSLTKVLTGTAAMRLAAEGTLALDDPLERWLTRTPPTGITLRHLLDHTSGLPRLPPGTARFRDPYRSFTEHALDGLIPRLDVLLVGEPGRSQEYSNFGYAVLGAALAAADRQPYEQLVRERVLSPLGLADHFAAHPPPDRALRATGFLRRSRRTWTLDGAILPAGGMWATSAGAAALLTRLIVDRVLGDPAPTWQRAGKLLWHNGGTRHASTFAGAFPGGEWIFIHRLGGSADRTDQLAASYLKAVRRS